MKYLLGSGLVKFKSESEPLTLTTYLELMKGFIVTAEDVEVLKDKKVPRQLKKMKFY